MAHSSVETVSFLIRLLIRIGGEEERRKPAVGTGMQCCGSKSRSGSVRIRNFYLAGSRSEIS